MLAVRLPARLAFPILTWLKCDPKVVNLISISG